MNQAEDRFSEQGAPASDIQGRNTQTPPNLRLDRPRPVKLSGVSFPTAGHALIAAPQRDSAWRAHVAGRTLNELERAAGPIEHPEDRRSEVRRALRSYVTGSDLGVPSGEPDDTWEARRSEVHRALLLHHFTPKEGGLTVIKALVITGSQDLTPVLGRLPLRPDDQDSVIREATLLRYQLQEFFAGQFAETPTCVTCRHARKAMNASVVACARSGGEAYSLDRPVEAGPKDARPFATGWGRPGMRPGVGGPKARTADEGLIRKDMPLMELLDSCAAYARLKH